MSATSRAAKAVIEIQRASDEPAPPDEQLVHWAGEALNALAKDGDVTIRLVDEAEMTQLNGDYRGKAGTTNVLSFPCQMPEGLPAGAVDLPLGDIVICPAVVRAEASAQGKPEAAHWAHMVVHGVLHLCGHDHQHDDEADVMEDLERRILATQGFPDPYMEKEA